MSFDEEQGSRYRGIRALATCEHCGMPLPLTGPVRQADCAHCHQTNRFAPALWQEVLERADGAPGPFAAGRLDVDVVTQEPPAALRDGAQAPPDWLAERMPSLRRVLGTERADAADERAAPVKLDDAPGPVTMDCPECGAALKIDTQTPRTTTCQYCSADLYLPDELWRGLHPVSTAARRWYVELAGESGWDREARLDDARSRLAALRAAAGGLQRRYLNAATVVRYAALLCLPAGIGSCAVGLLQTGDPLFGPHARLLCPRVCDGCEGPYQFKTGEDALDGRLTYPVWCAGPAGRVEVPTLAWYLVFPLPLWIAWFALLLPAVAWWAARKDRRARAQLADLERQIAAAQAELGRG